MTLPWRRWNAVLHRDLGYLCAGLTLVYAISGLAVNHIADWNPNYRQVKRAYELGPLPKDLPEATLVKESLARLRLSEKPKGSFQFDADTLQIFLKGATITVDLPTGRATFEGLQARPGLLAFNRLHLNAPKRAWTYLADLYALSLIALTLTGLFLLRGRQGLGGRGAWLTALGCALPLAYWVWWANF
jgi:uncharacterized protein